MVSLLARQKPPEAAEAGMAAVVVAVGVIVAVAVAAAATGGGMAGQAGCFPGVGQSRPYEFTLRSPCTWPYTHFFGLATTAL